MIIFRNHPVFHLCRGLEIPKPFYLSKGRGLGNYYPLGDSFNGKGNFLLASVEISSVLYEISQIRVFWP